MTGRETIPFMVLVALAAATLIGGVHGILGCLCGLAAWPLAGKVGGRDGHIERITNEIERVG